MRKEIIGDATLYLGDCMEIMKDMPDKIVDAVVTDPPYGLSMGEKKNHQCGRYGKQTSEHHLSSNWDDSAPSPEMINRIKSISIYQIIWGANYFHEALSSERGWIVWDKLNDKFYSNSDAELAWTNINMRLKMFRRPHGMDKGFMVKDGFGNVHPTQKPIPLMIWCIEQLPKGQTILDPFMGSGTTGVACMELGRKFIGIEIEPKYFDIACKRIDAAERQGKLFTDAD